MQALDLAALRGCGSLPRLGSCGWKWLSSQPRKEACVRIPSQRRGPKPGCTSDLGSVSALCPQQQQRDGLACRRA